MEPDCWLSGACVFGKRRDLFPGRCFPCPPPHHPVAGDGVRRRGREAGRSGDAGRLSSKARSDGWRGALPGLAPGGRASPARTRARSRRWRRGASGVEPDSGSQGRTCSGSVEISSPAAVSPLVLAMIASPVTVYAAGGGRQVAAATLGGCRARLGALDGEVRYAHPIAAASAMTAPQFRRLCIFVSRAPWRPGALFSISLPVRVGEEVCVREGFVRGRARKRSGRRERRGRGEAGERTRVRVRPRAAARSWTWPTARAAGRARGCALRSSRDTSVPPATERVRVALSMRGTSDRRCA